VTRGRGLRRSGHPRGGIASVLSDFLTSCEGKQVGVEFALVVTEHPVRAARVVPAALLALSRRPGRPADGLLPGVACGACFAVLETRGDALLALVRSGGELTLVTDQGGGLWGLLVAP
jgi:hypothetical protein